jgi:hypothetical protein
MTKILYFDHFSAATEFYRLMPLEYLKSDQFTITRSTEKNINMMVIEPYDVIIFSRPSSEAHVNAIKLCKDQHKKVIGDFDDDILHVPQENPMYATYEIEKSNSIKCLAMCDELWVATDGIKKSYRLYNKNIHIIPNAHNDTIFPVKNKKPFEFNKVAMWRGGGSHIGDIYAPKVTEYIIDMINSNPVWKFYSLGQRFEFIEYRLTESNYYRNDGASTIQFYKMMQEFQPCAFYYPLNSNIFNQGKSNCSFLESVYSGAAYFGNTDLSEIQKPGVMHYMELKDMMRMSDKKLAKILDSNHKKSWQYIEQHLLLSKINLRRLSRLTKFVS